MPRRWDQCYLIQYALSRIKLIAISCQSKYYVALSHVLKNELHKWWKCGESNFADPPTTDTNRIVRFLFCHRQHCMPYHFKHATTSTFLNRGNIFLHVIIFLAQEFWSCMYSVHCTLYIVHILKLKAPPPLLPHHKHPSKKKRVKENMLCTLLCLSINTSHFVALGQMIIWTTCAIPSKWKTRFVCLQQICLIDIQNGLIDI